MSDNRDLEKNVEQGPEAPTPCQQEHPHPSKVGKSLRRLLIGGAAAAVATSIFVYGTFTGLPGSTRSARLKLQARQAQIETAATQEAAANAQKTTDDGLGKAR